MIDSFYKYQEGITKAFWETNFMVGVALVTCLVFAIPLGILLFSLRQDYLLQNRTIYQILSISLNAIRSIPFLIFIFLLIPVSRFLFQSSFGNLAATLPLALVSISIYTRFVEQAFLGIPKKIIDRAISMGATKMQIIRYFLLPATKKDLILSFTSVTISLLSYSTVMGVIGAGGLGEFAYRYGYQEYDFKLMYLVVAIFIIYVFIIQSIGYRLARKYINSEEKK